MSNSQPLVTLTTALAQARGRAAADGLELDPEYSWSPENLADQLMDLDEPVFTHTAAGGTLVWFTTPEVSDKLVEFCQDFTTPIAVANA